MKTLSIIALVAAVGAAANAQTFNEIGDAPDTPPGQSVTDGTTRIEGTDTGNDADVFAFRWGGGVLTIDTFGTLYDTQLHLFFFDGTGIGENDDAAAGGLQSEISLDLAAGDYLIGITQFNKDALDAGGLPIFGFNNTFSDLNGNFIQGPEGNGPLAGWDSTSGSGGAYGINFSAPVNAIPAPGALALLGLGGLAAVRRRR